MLFFFDENKRHANYALVCLAVSQKEAAAFIRRFLRNPAFNTKSKRRGIVAYVNVAGVRVWRFGADEEEFVAWVD